MIINDRLLQALASFEIEDRLHLDRGVTSRVEDVIPAIKLHFLGLNGAH